jgi:putative FmdB family regulatory protein
MPVYEFRCRDCGEDFEVDCHMREREEKAVCPQCGSRNVESVLTANFVSPRPPKY